MDKVLEIALRLYTKYFMAIQYPLPSEQEILEQKCVLLADQQKVTPEIG